MSDLSPILPEDFAPALDKVEKVYGIRPDWVEGCYSNDKLAPWQAAVTWTILDDEDNPIKPYIQLRKHFQKNETLFGIYHKKDILAHELAHIGREDMNEPIFEEFFAYQCGGSPLGPIIRSPKEVWVLLAASFCNILFPIFYFFAFAPFLLISLFFTVRFFRTRCIFNKCRQKLQKTAGDKAMHIMYRLTDKEIFKLGSQEA